MYIHIYIYKFIQNIYRAICPFHLSIFVLDAEIEKEYFFLSYMHVRRENKKEQTKKKKDNRNRNMRERERDIERTRQLFRTPFQVIIFRWHQVKRYSGQERNNIYIYKFIFFAKGYRTICLLLCLFFIVLVFFDLVSVYIFLDVKRKGERECFFSLTCVSNEKMKLTTTRQD